MLLRLSIGDLIIHIGVALHIICMTGLILFGCHRFWLILGWRKTSEDLTADSLPINKTPRVTIQLPLNLLISILLIFFSFCPIAVACQRETLPAIPFLCQFPLGFSIVAIRELHELLN